MSSSPIEVSNLVNLSNLEKVFGDVYDKISKITTRVDKIESDLASTVSLSRFLSHQNETQSNTKLFESRIKYLEETISSLKPIIQKSNNNSTNIETIYDKLSKKYITHEIYDESVNDIKENLNDKIEDILANKCSNDRMKKIEESTKNILQQIIAMESLIQCKVDKSHIPLLQSCQKQLDTLERFRDQISQRICIMDDNISDINNDLNSKINENTFDDLSIEIKKLMQSKVDMKFLNKEVITRLNILLPDLLVLLKEHKQISITKCFDRIKIMETKINTDIQNKININISNIDSILKQFHNIPSVQQIELKADKAFCENINKDCKDFCENNKNNLQTSIDKIENEINKLKTISNSLTDKTQIALRFVDWYSKLQLET